MQTLGRIAYVLIFIASIAAGLYVGGWVMFIQPIIDACAHFDAGTLSAVVIGTTILKCIFASTVGTLIIAFGTLIAGLIASVVD